MATTLAAHADPACRDAHLEPFARMSMLCDPGSLRRLPSPQSRGAPGVVAATGRVQGRQVVCYAQDSSISGGAVGTLEAETVVHALRLARRYRRPVIGFVESAGARLQEGAAALAAFGRIFFENVALLGSAPQISVMTGTAAGGGCYSPALTDFVVMTRPSTMFLTGPTVVRQALGEEVTADDLGGAHVHERNGVCHFSADDDADAISIVRELLGYLSPANGRRSTAAGGLDPAREVPASPREVYDVRTVVRAVMDDGDFLECWPRWARNMVTGFARLEGRPVGIVANQPRYLGGVIDVAASQKGSRFVTTCAQFGVPLVVLVDAPGFMPGLRQEAAGIIRHGAALVRAFVSAEVPRLTVVLRKAYGGAYISMNSKDLGADHTLAWKGAEIGIMGPLAAVRIIHRRALVSAPESLAETLSAEYAARHLSSERALDLGVIDEVIKPHETRARLASALRAAERRHSRR